jgi:hypothetical protein
LIGDEFDGRRRSETHIHERIEIMTSHLRVSAVMAVMAAAVLCACAGLPSARMALPEPLAAQTPTTVQGLGAGRQGEFTLGKERGRFERGADRLTVFDVLAFDRVSAHYRSATTSATCRGRQTEATLGVLTGAPRPFEFRCRFDGAFAGELELNGRAGAGGTQQQRSGRLVAGAVVIDIVSVHRLQGTPLPIAFPAGYLLTVEGRPVGAVELTDTRPRVWLPAGPQSVTTAATHAAITLALLWDPSQRVE